jgi:hypothetical protein
MKGKNSICFLVSKGALDNYFTGSDKSTLIDWEFELSKELKIRGEGSVYNK